LFQRYFFFFTSVFLLNNSRQLQMMCVYVNEIGGCLSPRTGGVLGSGCGCAERIYDVISYFKRSSRIRKTWGKRIIEMLSHGGTERIQNVVYYFEDLFRYMHRPASVITVVQTRIELSIRKWCLIHGHASRGEIAENYIFKISRTWICWALSQSQRLMSVSILRMPTALRTDNQIFQLKILKCKIKQK
jgi:hypothetical protein